MFPSRWKKSLNLSLQPSQHQLPPPRQLRSLQPPKRRRPSLRHPPRPRLPKLAPQEFLVPETILLPRARACLAPVSLARETILLLQPREWVAPPPADLARVQHRSALSIVKVEHDPPSKPAPAALVVVPVAPVLLAPVPADLQVVPVVAPAAVAPEPVVAVAAQVEEPREPLVVVEERANLVSQSGRSVKSLKCGRPRA